MNIQSLGNFYDDGILNVNGVLRGTIPIRSGWRANRREANRHDLIVNAKLKEFRLLEMRVQFHLIRGRFDLCVS